MRFSLDMWKYSYKPIFRIIKAEHCPVMPKNQKELCNIFDPSWLCILTLHHWAVCPSTPVAQLYPVGCRGITLRYTHTFKIILHHISVSNVLGRKAHTSPCPALLQLSKIIFVHISQAICNNIWCRYQLLQYSEEYYRPFTLMLATWFGITVFFSTFRQHTKWPHCAVKQNNIISSQELWYGDLWFHFDCKQNVMINSQTNSCGRKSKFNTHIQCMHFHLNSTSTQNRKQSSDLHQIRYWDMWFILNWDAHHGAWKIGQWDGRLNDKDDTFILNLRFKYVLSSQWRRQSQRVLFTYFCSFWLLNFVLLTLSYSDMFLHKDFLGLYFISSTYTFITSLSIWGILQLLMIKLWP